MNLDARGLLLNLTVICQRFDIKLGSNLITVRGVVLNLIIIYQRCDVNMTTVDLRYEQF